MRFSFMILNLSLMDTLLKFMYDITPVRLVDIDAPIVPLFWGGGRLMTSETDPVKSSK